MYNITEFSYNDITLYGGIKIKMDRSSDQINVKVNVEYLKKYKESKNLTNKQLADKIGVHESTISRILREKKGIGYKFIVGAIYRLEDIDIHKLFVKEKAENEKVS